MKLFKSLRLVFLQVLLLAAFGLFYLMVVARYLGPAGLGLYAVTVSIVRLALALTLFGLQSASTKFISEYYTQERYEALLATTRIAYLSRAVLGLIALAILYLLAPLISNLYGYGELEESLRVGSVMLLLYSLFYLTVSCLEGFQEFGKILKLNLIFVLVSSVATILFLERNPTVTAPIMGTSLGLLAATIYGGVVLYLKIPVRKLRSKEVYKEQAGKMFRFAIPHSGAYVFTLLFDNVGNIIVGLFAPAVVLGQFAFAYQVANYATRANSVARTVLLPKFSELLARMREGDLRRLFQGALKGLLLFTTVAVGLSIVFAVPFTRLLGGVKFLPAVRVFQILMVVNVARGSNPPLNSLYLAYGRTGILARLAGLQCLLALTLVLLLFPLLGITGAAMGILSSVVAVFLYNLRLATTVVPEGFTSRRYGLFCLGVVVFFLVSIFAEPWVSSIAVVGAAIILWIKKSEFVTTFRLEINVAKS